MTGARCESVHSRPTPPVFYRADSPWRRFVTTLLNSQNRPILFLSLSYAQAQGRRSAPNLCGDFYCAPRQRSDVAEFTFGLPIASMPPTLRERRLRYASVIRQQSVSQHPRQLIRAHWRNQRTQKLRPQRRARLGPSWGRRGVKSVSDRRRADRRRTPGARRNRTNPRIAGYNVVP